MKTFSKEQFVANLEVDFFVDCFEKRKVDHFSALDCRSWHLALFSRPLAVECLILGETFFEKATFEALKVEITRNPHSTSLLLLLHNVVSAQIQTSLRTLPHNEERD